MNDFEDKGVAITLAALALSGLVVLAAQTKSLGMEKALLEKQVVVLAERVTASKAANKQVDETIEQREVQVKRAAATEAQYAGLLQDLLELAKVDSDARAVTQKWKIQASGEPSKSSEDPANKSGRVSPAEVVPSPVAKPKASQ
jgi:hypothetical protein